MSVLSLNNLEIGYAKKPVAHIKQFALKKNEHGLLLGKSGSGKTTLLHSIAGIVPVRGGEITVVEKNITTLSQHECDDFRGKHIGMIFQALHLIPALTVLENLLMVGYANGHAIEAGRAQQLLKEVGLEKYQHTKPTELSQGQQQRVAIVRAVVHNPALILGDEITSALDDDNCHAVMQLLLKVASQSNSCLLIATHDARIKPYFTKTLSL